MEKQEGSAATAAAEIETLETLAGWTNADVIRWLLDVDLKQFIPACIANNVVGEQLSRDTRAEELFADSGLELQYKGFEAQLAKLRRKFGIIKSPAAPPPVARPPDDLIENRQRHASVEVRTESGESRVRLGTSAGRAVQVANNWSFELEMTEWRLYQECFVERVKIQHLRERLSRMREGCTLALLIISTFTTLITSAAAGIVGGGSSAEEGTVNEGAEASVDVHLSAAVTWVQHNSTYVLLLFSFVTTLLSGFVQTQSAFWKRIDKDGRAHENYYVEYEEFFKDQLLVLPEHRLRFSEYLKQRREWQKRFLKQPDLNVPPNVMSRAVERVRTHGPSDWNKGFIWLGTSLRWPKEPEIVEAMLIEFSMSELGKHTLPRMCDDDLVTYRRQFDKMKWSYFRHHRLEDRMSCRLCGCTFSWRWLCVCLEACFCCCCIKGYSGSEHAKTTRLPPAKKKDDAGPQGIFKQATQSLKRATTRYVTLKLNQSSATVVDVEKSGTSVSTGV